MKSFSDDTSAPWSAALCGRDPDKLNLTYVSSPLGAPTREGVRENFLRALYAMTLLAREGWVPVAGHVLYPLLLDEHEPTDRTLGILFDMALLARCAFVVCFTPDGTSRTLSGGMQADVERARSLGMSIEYRRLPELPEGWTGSWLIASPSEVVAD